MTSPPVKVVSLFNLKIRCSQKLSVKIIHSLAYVIRHISCSIACLQLYNMYCCLTHAHSEMHSNRCPIPAARHIAALLRLPGDISHATFWSYPALAPVAWCVP